jgi:ABC-2 type transport system permease protein
LGHHWGKYLGSLLLTLIVLIPTITYVYTIGQLAGTPENVDYGSIIGSYMGLLFLASAITAIGLFTSTLSNNQIVAFIIGLALSFFMFYGFEAMDQLISMENFDVKNMGLYAHYVNIGRGVVDTKDLIYFISVSIFFLYITKINFDHK